MRFNLRFLVLLVLFSGIASWVGFSFFDSFSRARFDYLYVRKPDIVKGQEHPVCIVFGKDGRFIYSSAPPSKDLIQMWLGPTAKGIEKGTYEKEGKKIFKCQMAKSGEKFSAVFDAKGLTLKSTERPWMAGNYELLTWTYSARSLE